MYVCTMYVFQCISSLLHEIKFVFDYTLFERDALNEITSYYPVAVSVYVLQVWHTSHGVERRGKFKWEKRVSI